MVDDNSMSGDLIPRLRQLEEEVAELEEQVAELQSSISELEERSLTWGKVLFGFLGLAAFAWLSTSLGC